MKYIKKYNLFEEESKILSSQDMLSIQFEELDFQGDWLELFGQPAPSFDFMLDGGAGDGKTTFLIKFAKYLAVNFGKVLYISSEEFGTSTLNKKIEEIQAIHDNLFWTENLKHNLEEYDFIIIDSVNDLKLKLSQYKYLREEYPLTAFILSVQHTKAGDYRGGKDWEHEVEIAGTIEEGVVSIYKNRYGVKGELNSFEPISSIPKEKKERDIKKD